MPEVNDVFDAPWSGTMPQLCWHKDLFNTEIGIIVLREFGYREPRLVDKAYPDHAVLFVGLILFQARVNPAGEFRFLRNEGAFPSLLYCHP